MFSICVCMCVYLLTLGVKFITLNNFLFHKILPLTVSSYSLNFILRKRRKLLHLLSSFLLCSPTFIIFILSKFIIFNFPQFFKFSFIFRRIRCPPKSPLTVYLFLLFCIFYFSSGQEVLAFSSQQCLQ